MFGSSHAGSCYLLRPRIQRFIPQALDVLPKVSHICVHLVKPCTLKVNPASPEHCIQDYVDIDSMFFGPLWAMAGVQLTSILLPGTPAVPVTVAEGHADLQAQWAVPDFMLNLFTTKKITTAMARFREPEKVAQVSDMHREIYAGQPVPKLLKTKHEAEASGATKQPFYLKGRTMPTSLAFSWMGWAISHYKRQGPEVERARSFCRQLLAHILEHSGAVPMQVQALGTAFLVDVEVRHPGGHFPPDILWRRIFLSRLRPAWEMLRREGIVISDLQRPTLADVVFFGLCPPGGAHEAHAGELALVRPLSLSLLRQLATWVDGKMLALSLEQLSYHLGMEKNQARQQVALRAAVTVAAMHYLQENEPG